MDGDRLVIEDASDGFRNQLLSMLFRTIVVTAVSNHHFQTIGMMVGSHEQVTRRFTSTVGGVRQILTVFSEQAILP